MKRLEKFTRRNLPHWYVPGAAHFVTYRVAGTIPIAVLEELRHHAAAKLKKAPPPGLSVLEHRLIVHKQSFADYDRYLDKTCKVDWLARADVASVIRDNLYHHHGGKYHLLAYCVMPNHVHVLFQPIDGTSKLLVPTYIGETDDRNGPLAKIMHSLKSYTANKINELLERPGQFWQHESYDHWVRDDEELERIVEYIAANPVKAGLACNAEDWLFCSARDRFLRDGLQMAWLGDIL